MTPPFRYFEVLTVPRVTNNLPPQTSAATTSANLSRASGFTTVELLTVIGIMVVLAAIAVVGFKFVGDRTKGNSVRVTLETLKSVTQEAETAGAFRRQPPGVYEPDNTWVRIDPAAAPYGNGLIPDFWRRQDVSSTVTTSATAASWSPGNVRADRLPPTYGTFDPDAAASAATADWRDAPAIKNTGIALGLLRAVPGPAKSLDGLPNSVAKLPVFWSPTVAYKAGTRVLFRGNSNATANSDPMNVFRALRDVAAGASPPITAGIDNADWARDAATIVDAFGNPMILVPSSGLHLGALYSASGSYSPGDRVYTGTGASRVYYEAIAPAGPGQPTTNTSFWRVATPVRSPDGRPFWASAGADGNFDTPADNLYSFEN